jgi:glycosyltransferase involved in cell wall biosynthesis
MRVLFFTLGTEVLASSRTRVHQYIPYLQKEGVVCTVHPAGLDRRLILSVQGGPGWKLPLVQAWGRLEKAIRGALFFCRVPFYDVAFVQKILLPIPFQKLLRVLNSRIIFDFDDAIYVPHQVQRSFWPAETNRRWFEHMLSISQWVVLENQYTAAYARPFSKQILQITGPIEVHRYTPRSGVEPRDRIVLGWVGTPSNTIYLEILRETLERLGQQYPHVSLLLVGAASFHLENMPVEIRPWSLVTEVTDLQQFDIGLMPLPDDEWSRGKGGYKLLQYMAIGIPSIASPVGIVSEMIVEGENGFLAITSEEWYEKLGCLIEDPGLRARMGQKGRKVAEEQYSFEVAVPQLWAVLREVADVQ